MLLCLIKYEFSDSEFLSNDFTTDITLSAQEIQQNPEIPSAGGIPRLTILISVLFTVVFVAVLLLVVGLFYCRNHKGKPHFLKSVNGGNVLLNSFNDRDKE